MLPNTFLSQNNDNASDVIYLLHFINSFVEGIGLDNVEVDVKNVSQIVNQLHTGFPQTEEVNIFKKSAAFLTYFMELSPIRTPFPADLIGELSRIDNHQNSIVAMDIVFDLLGFDSNNLSAHSYVDIIEAMSSVNIKQFRVVSVFLEQLYYRAQHEDTESSNN